MQTLRQVLVRASLISLLAVSTAQASVVFTLTRLSDSTASVVGSGTLDGPMHGAGVPAACPMIGQPARQAMHTGQWGGGQSWARPQSP